MKAYEIAEKLNDEEPKYAKLAKHPDVTVEKLEQLLHTANVELQSRVVCLTGHIGSKESLKILRKAAKDTNEVVRMAAAVGACRAPRGAAGRRLINGLLEDESAAVRQAVVLSLCSKVVGGFADSITYLAENDPDEHVRASAELRISTLSDGDADSADSAQVLGDGVAMFADGGLLLAGDDSTDGGQLIPTDAILPGEHI